MTRSVVPRRARRSLVVGAGHRDPHAVLGAHPHDGGVTVRMLRPLATSVEIRHGDDVTALTHEHDGHLGRRAARHRRSPTTGSR